MTEIISVVSAPDPFKPKTNYADQMASTAYALRARADDGTWLNSGENTAVILALGQSNIGNWIYGSYSSTNTTKIDMFNWRDGGVYAGQAPLLGCDVGVFGGVDNWLLRLADDLITNEDYDRVIICCLAIGGQKAEYFASTALERITIACRRLRAAGLAPTHILWGHGEADANDNNGVSGNTSQESYEASVNTIIAHIRTFGFDAPFLVALETYWNGVVGASGPGRTAIRAAQAALVNPGAGVYAGPDLDDLVYPTDRDDSTHFNATGAATVASRWRTAMLAV